MNDDFSNGCGEWTVGFIIILLIVIVLLVMAN